MKQNHTPKAHSNKDPKERLALFVLRFSLAALALLAVSDNIPSANKTRGIKSTTYRTPTEILPTPSISHSRSIPFSSDAFKLKIDSILSEAIIGLKHYYKTEDIIIKVNSHKRSFEKQEKLSKSKRSKTVISHITMQQLLI